MNVSQSPLSEASTEVVDASNFSLGQLCLGVPNKVSPHGGMAWHFSLSNSTQPKYERGTGLFHLSSVNKTIAFNQNLSTANRKIISTWICTYVCINLEDTAAICLSFSGLMS